MPRYTVRKELSPDKGYPCVYRNWRARSHCRFFHGYDLRFAITYECSDKLLTPEAWVYDFGSFDLLKEELDNTFDHKFIVAVDDPELTWCEEIADRGMIDLVTLPQVGAEAFACWLSVRATDQLQEAGRLDKVRVYCAEVKENGANSACYFPFQEIDYIPGM